MQAVDGRGQHQFTSTQAWLPVSMYIYIYYTAPSEDGNFPRVTRRLKSWVGWELTKANDNLLTTWTLHQINYRTVAQSWAEQIPTKANDNLLGETSSNYYRTQSITGKQHWLFINHYYSSLIIRHYHTAHPPLLQGPLWITHSWHGPWGNTLVT